MTLAQLSAALVTNTSLMVTLVDASGNTLIKYNAAGYEVLDDTTLAMTVNKVTVAGQYALTVIIAE